MKHGKRPTVRQCKAIQKAGFDPAEWLVVKDTPEIFVIVNRTDNTTHTIHKEQ